MEGTMTDQYYPQQGYPAYPREFQAGPHYYQTPEKNGLAVAAMVVGIVALVLSFVPLLGLLSFVLGPLALILGIFALSKPAGKPQAVTGVITGSLSFVVVLIGTMLFGAAVSSFEEEDQGTEREAAEIEAVEEEAEEAAEVEDTREEEGEEPEPAEAAGDTGSRSNPLALGDTVADDSWEVTIHGITRDADDLIAAENQFSDPSPEGYSYALVDVSMTYLGDESDTAIFGTGIAYVTGGGETISAYEQLAIAPEEFDLLRELYNGGTERGNIAIALPDDDPDGTLRVRLGFLSTEDYFFDSE